MATMSLSALGETSGVVVRGVARLALEYSNAEVPAHGVSLKAFKTSGGLVA